MFTGIIEAVGTLARVEREGAGMRLGIDSQGLDDSDVQPGDSIAVDGVCLTVETIDQGRLDFRVTRETLDRTTLGRATEGRRVNLEKSLTYGGRVGGHLVSGHVDGVGRIVSIRRVRNDWLFRFEVPDELRWALVPKGSIAVDGISLTIVEPRERQFSVAIVQFTLDHTILQDRAAGDSVHIEGDLMGRWVAHLLSSASGSDAADRAVDADRLRELGGFAGPDRQWGAEADS